MTERWIHPSGYLITVVPKGRVVMRWDCPNRAWMPYKVFRSDVELDKEFPFEELLEVVKL